MPVFLADSFADSLVVAAALLGATYLLLRQNAKRRKETQDGPAGPRLSLSQQRAVERHMETLLVELTELSRQVSSQLDSRATKLDLLIQEADAKIESLKRSLNQASSSGAGGSYDAFAQDADLPPPPIPIRPAPGPPRADPRYADVYALADQGLSSQQIAHQLKQPTGEVELILALRRRPG